MQHLWDLRRLYLSGTKLHSLPINQTCFNLIYLELAMCQLTFLPDDLATLIPNVRVIDLSHNFIQDLHPLRNLTRLKKLNFTGGRVEKVRGLKNGLENIPQLEEIDFR